VNSPAHFFGVGIYSVSEASRLTGVSARRVRGWLAGYEDAGEPALRGQLQPVEGRIALGFLDLLEIRFVKHFLERRVSWRTIRLAAAKARLRFHTDHPFALRRFVTDGRDIFAATAEETVDRRLEDLVRDQYAMFAILEPLLTEGIEFDEAGMASSWRPDDRHLPQVVLDPRRSYGHPIVSSAGVPTARIYEAFRAGNGVERIAAWFQIEPAEVRQAVDFELRFAA
jgi:uncharacterized protein (DUF433 family)